VSGRLDRPVKSFAAAAQGIEVEAVPALNLEPDLYIRRFVDGQAIAPTPFTQLSAEATIGGVK